MVVDFGLQSYPITFIACTFSSTKALSFSDK